MKPRIPQEFFINDDLSALPPIERILFLGMLMLSADEDGVLPDRPRRIKAQVLPYESDAQVGDMLDELESFGLITRHPAESPDDIALIVINDFEERWQFEETD